MTLPPGYFRTVRLPNGDVQSEDGATRVPTICQSCGKRINAWVFLGDERKLTRWMCPNPECHYEQDTEFRGNLKCVAFGVTGVAKA